MVSLAFTVLHCLPLPSSGNPQIFSSQHRVQLYNSSSLQRSMTEIFRLGLVNNRPLFCDSYMKFKNFTGSTNEYFILTSQYNKKSFSLGGFRCNPRIQLLILSGATTRVLLKFSFLNVHSSRLNNLLPVKGGGLHHKLSMVHKT